LDPEKAVRSEAPRIASALREAAERARNEAELRTAATRIIGDFAEQLDLDLDLHEEYTLLSGRADAVYNRFVIEYEPPRSLRDRNTHSSNAHAIDQVKQYLEELSEVQRRKLKRLAGAATDGQYFIFARFRDGHWRVDDALPVTPSSTERFLRYLTSLSTELPLTPDNLLRDFGEGTPVAAGCVGTLYAALSRSDHPKVTKLFDQWQRQFSEVCGWERQSSRLDTSALASAFGVDEEDPDPLRLFFAVHTYYATFIKLLAVQIASYYAFPRLGTGLVQVASYSSEKLCSYLEKMERGGVFTDFGISNFLEGDFFGWYLDIWTGEIDQAIREVITQLSLYSLVTLDVDPEETRDLLKKLYQNLIPRKLRHALGEYYTPDWLAERLLNQLCGAPKRGQRPSIDPSKRLLDPACGSGTFLVLAIRRMRNWAEERMMPEYEVLEKILSNVVGFDLNPLAVISARTNYLLALGDLIQHRRGEISTPVYLADSILTPSTGETLFDQDSYSFNTAVGRFAVPRLLVDAQDIDRLAGMLEESVEVGLTEEQFQHRAAETFPVLAENEGQLALAGEVYRQLKELDEEGINGIWARVIKNAFAPLFQGRFDYVMGNPPWVNWESLPEDYRRETVPLWHQHGMLPAGGLESILGGSKMDISMLMTFVAIDRYVRDGGKLGFLITQSVFKTSGAGQGFRAFTPASGIAVGPLVVDDMSELKPFPGAANRTAILVLRRGARARYPVKYIRWRGVGGRRTIAEDSSLEEVAALTVRRVLDAEPVDDSDPTSAWITGYRAALKAARKLIGPSPYEAHEGVNTGGANAVYWIDVLHESPGGSLVVRNVTEGAKRKVDEVEAAIEAELVYPLLRGRDVDRWSAVPSIHILMTKVPGTAEKAIPEAEMRLAYPKTYAYFNRFRSPLGLRRDAVLLRLRGSIPFYSMGAIADHTFVPYRVVWREVSNYVQAAVPILPTRGERVAIPDHTLVAVEAGSQGEAHYLCALLNSSAANFVVVGYIAMHPSPHIMQKVGIPGYDERDEVHMRLASLSVDAHKASAAGETVRVKQIEEEIDQLAAELWGLTAQELADIKRSLEELS